MHVIKNGPKISDKHVGSKGNHADGSNELRLDGIRTVGKPTAKVELAASSDAKVICEIRDEAWLDTYPNKELGITLEQVRLNAQGRGGVFVPRRIAWLEKKIAGSQDDWITYVAKIDGVVRGFVIVSVDEGRKFINSIYVQPGFQGAGLGWQLMQKALEWTGRDEDVYLEVASYNDGAIRFYEQLGFEKTGKPVKEESDRPDYITPIPQIEMLLPAKSK